MAIPKPKPSDWQVANAQELQVTDREVLAMLRAAKKRVDGILADLPPGGVNRAQLEQTRSRLLAEQASVFERLGDIVSARRASAASRSARLSAAADASLLSLVGKGTQAQYLYDSALEVGQRAIDVALQRIRFSATPLSQRIYQSSVWMGGRLGKLINETLASGLNAREFAKRARDWFSPNTPGGVRYAAMRLARTEINNAFHSISAQKYAETPWITEVDWNLSKSHPKEDECNPLAKASPFPSDKVPARPHPQCMCYITPKSVDEDEFINRFISGEYDEYLDAELDKAGWNEVQPDPQPIKAIETPEVWTPPVDPGGPPPFTDDAWNQIQARMEELKRNPPPPPVKKPRVKPADRPDGAKLSGRGRVEAPADETENVREIGRRISSKVNKRLKGKIKRVAAIHETYIGDKVRRISLVESGMPKDPNFNARNTFAVTYYDSGSVFLHSGFEGKGDVMAGCTHSHHFVGGGDDAHENVIAHEFGHAFLSDHRLNATAIAMMMEVIDDALQLKYRVEITGDRNELIQRLQAIVVHPDNKDIITNLVSGYAATSFNELVAEVWADYTMNPDPAPHIKRIGDMMKQIITSGEGLSALSY